MLPDDVLSPYEFQRLVFSKAVEFGWPGRQLLTLGDAEADEAFQDAFRFLNSIGPSEATLANSRRRPSTSSEFQPAR
jgi:hypothetical protein